MSDNPRKLPTRQSMDDADGRALVEEWRASGLSGTSFCRSRGLRPARLHYWRGKLGYPIRCIGDQSQAMTAPPAPTSTGFVQVMAGPTIAPPNTDVSIFVGGLEIRVPPGFDANHLRSIVAALSRPSC